MKSRVRLTIHREDHKVDALGLVFLGAQVRELKSFLMDHLYRVFRRFDESGLAAFMDEWRKHDWLRGRQITVDMPDREVSGIAAGVDDSRTGRIVDVHHGAAVGLQQLGEQPQLGGQIGLHGAVVVEVIARQVGEGCGADPDPIQSILV